MKTLIIALALVGSTALASNHDLADHHGGSVMLDVPKVQFNGKDFLGTVLVPVTDVTFNEGAIVTNKEVRVCTKAGQGERYCGAGKYTRLATASKFQKEIPVGEGSDVEKVDVDLCKKHQILVMEGETVVCEHWYKIKGCP